MAPDLVKEYFKRDLTLGEEEQLDQILSSSESEIFRYH